MMSFLAKVTYFQEIPERGPDLYLRRVSSRIRGEEIANYLGAKFNPAQRDESDLSIWIKPKNLIRVKDGDYVDMLDDPFLVMLLLERPGVNVITMTQYQHDYLRPILKNKLVLIPHHHINFENVRNEKREIRTCGFVGAYLKERLVIDEEIKKLLSGIGFEFLPLLDFKTREDAIANYKKIDIQLLVYPLSEGERPTPVKIINAASFGIPTIALPRLEYQEVEGSYIRSGGLGTLVKEVLNLKENYDQWAADSISMAEKYHISNIAELYKKL
jgi:hypothetical protein